MVNAQTIDNQTIQGNESNMLPINSTLEKPVPKKPDIFYFPKSSGTDMTIGFMVKNPIKFSGNVTDPNDIVHQMKRIDLGNGTLQLLYYSPLSDPSGTYVLRYNLVEGNQTKVISIGASFKYPQTPVMAIATPPPTPSELATVLSPLQQVKSLGFLPVHVICHDDLQLIIKSEDGSPACVKPDTAQKLVKRGWGLLMVQTSWFELSVGAVPNDWKYFPWAKEYTKSSDFSAVLESCHNATRITQYFENQGVTLIQIKAEYIQVANPFSMCGPANIYFLVSQIDASKMIELGYKVVNEKEVCMNMSCEELLNEQTVWFEFQPIQCQETPWVKYFAPLGSQLDLRGILKDYFEEHEGIKLIESMWTYYPNSQPPPLCGQPSDFSYFFLVPESSADKMINLGYMKVDNIPSDAHPVDLKVLRQ